MKTKVLTPGLFYLVMMNFVFSSEKNKQIKSWQELFTEPFEIVYIIMKDGARFKHTSQYEIRIKMSIGRLEETLKKIKGKNYSIKEIKLVIHNHRLKNYFTRSDYRQYWMLKKYGFNGLFLMYCHRTNKTYDIEENNKGRGK